MSGPLVDDFARRLVTLRLIQLIQRQKTSFQDNFAYWYILFLTILARRLVTLCLIQLHKTSFSRQLCISSYPLVDNLAWWLVTLCLIQRHKTSFFLTNLRNESPSCSQSCTTTRHFASNSTAQDVFFQDNFAYWVILSLTIFARRLVTLRLIQLIHRHKTSFQGNFAYWVILLLTISHDDSSLHV